MMAVADARLEAGAIARPQRLFARVGDEHRLALQHIHELVFARVPMTLTGPLTGRQAQQVDAELGQAGSVTEAPAPTSLALCIEGRRVAAAEAGGGGFDGDLLHGELH